MRLAQSAALAMLAIMAASPVLAEGYAYTPPASPAATEALQTPAKTPDFHADPGKRANLTAIDTTPGLIRPATRIAEWTSYGDIHRGFACADKKCRTVAPVYNTRTPQEQEQEQGGLETR